jgi:hypothetical protein
MTIDQKYVADSEYAEIDELAAQFPAFHQPSDCLSFARHLHGVMRRMFRFGERTTPDLDDGSGRRNPGDGRYTFAQARALGEELRALAAIHESNGVFDKHGVVRHLAPHIRALVDRDFTLAWVSETLMALGVDVTEAIVRECVYPPFPM